MRSDVNSDSVVNILDLAAVAAHYMQAYQHTDPPNGVDTGVQRMDQNGNDVINILDLSKEAAEYQKRVTDCP